MHPALHTQTVQHQVLHSLGTFCYYLMMPYRKVQFAPNEYYHLVNRGVGKKVLFKDKRDYSRFLFLILHLQYADTPRNISRHITYFVQHQVFNINTEVLGNRLVELTAFTLMPNHFHLVVRELGDSNVSDYMQRVLNAYAKYFNTKYKVTGHLFEGPFRAVHVEDNDQLLYVSAYVHRNPIEIANWKSRAHKYPWSSYQDYIGHNRWGGILQRDIILDQFESPSEYKNYIETSGAKETALDNVESP
jgi:putative transposase